MYRYVWLLGISLAGYAMSEGTVRILSVAELASAKVRWQIVDARPAERFAAGHLPGAVSMPWEEWSQERPGTWNAWFGDPSRWGKVLDDPAVVEPRLRRLGLWHDRPLVVVGEPRQWGEEGRVAWNLLFWGAREVALLDGGFPAWRDRHPERVEKGSAAVPSPGGFVVKLAGERRATVAQVRETMSLPRAILDARSPEEFAGKTLQAQKRGGRIPGAISLPVSAMYRDDGTFLSAEELKHLLPPAPKVAYCVGGVRSALVALIAEARLGIRVANYDGSLWEWERVGNLPLEP